MNKLKPTFTVALFLMLSTRLMAQISFADSTDSFLGNSDFCGYLTKAISDLNGDGLDDIIRSFPNTLDPELQPWSRSFELFCNVDITINKHRPEELKILIIDNAGFHSTKHISVLDNIELLNKNNYE